MTHELYSMLVAQIWQVTLLAIVVWITVRVAAKNRPQLAHLLWGLVLIKCLTPPVVSSHASPFSWISATQTVAVEAVSAPNSQPNPEWKQSSKKPAIGSQPPVVVHVDRANREPNKEFLQVKPAPASGDAATATIGWTSIILAIWLGGALIGACWTGLRLTLFLRWIRRSQLRESRQVEQLVARLSSQIGLRRRTKVRILDCPVGPAVLGLIRPEILLPASIVKEKTDQELEPLIAHELIHIRRGDLWWALVQTIAKNLFWFHPLVWYAAKMVTRESEQSCDEETVARLGCKPSTYARSLLDVLEHKNRLQVAPALPGVRPVDITSARLERVMKLGNGIHNRTPWWAWMVMLICGAMVLPGAAFVVSQDQKPDAKLQEAKLLPTVSKASTDYQLKTFDVSGILNDLRKHNGPGVDGGAERRLISVLPCRISNSKLAYEVVRFEGGEFKPFRLGHPEPTIKIRGDKLYVFDNPETLAIVEHILDDIRSNGFRKIVVQIRIVSGVGETWKDIKTEWNESSGLENELHVRASGELKDIDPMPTSTNGVAEAKIAEVAAIPTFIDLASTIDKPESNHSLKLVTHSEETHKLAFAVVENSDAESFFQTIKSSKSGEIVMAPTVVVNNGQEAVFKDGVERPFVTGYSALLNSRDGRNIRAPKVSVVAEGTTIVVKPTIESDGLMKLETQMILAEIQDVNEMNFPNSDAEDSETLRVQIPIVAVEQLRASLDIADGKTLLIRPAIDLQEGSAGGKLQDAMVMMTCRFVEAFPNPASVDFDKPVESPYELPPSNYSKLKSAESENSEELQTIENTLNVENEQTEIPQADFVIRSTWEGSDFAEKDIQTLEISGLKISIKTDVKIESTSDGVLISGSNLILEQKGGMTMRGDQARIRIQSEHVTEMKFTGNAKGFDDHGKYEADTIEVRTGATDMRFVMNGAGKISVHSQFSAEADKIHIDTEIQDQMNFEGNAVVVRFKDGKTNSEIRGNRILWNPETEDFTVEDK